MISYKLDCGGFRLDILNNKENSDTVSFLCEKLVAVVNR